MKKWFYTADDRIVFGLVLLSIVFLVFSAVFITLGLAEPAPKKPCQPGTKKCSSLVVPYHLDGSARPYVNITIDDKKFLALIDTGASKTLIDFKHTSVPGREEGLKDFHGEVIITDIAFMKVCLEGICDYEETNIVPNLVDVAILRGSFFDRFHTAKFDYWNKTITLEGWE